MIGLRSTPDECLPQSLKAFQNMMSRGEKPLLVLMTLRDQQNGDPESISDLGIMIRISDKQHLRSRKRQRSEQLPSTLDLRIHQAMIQTEDVAEVAVDAKTNNCRPNDAFFGSGQNELLDPRAIQPLKDLDDPAVHRACRQQWEVDSVELLGKTGHPFVGNVQADPRVVVAQRETDTTSITLHVDKRQFSSSKQHIERVDGDPYIIDQRPVEIPDYGA